MGLKGKTKQQLGCGDGLGPRRAGGWMAAMLLVGVASALTAGPGRPVGSLLEKEGRVEVGALQAAWQPATVGQGLAIGDRLRTLQRSRATLRLAELGIKRIRELTTLEILPPREPGSHGIIDLKAGAIYLFMRGQPREFQIQMPHAIGTSRGTDFLVEVDGAGRSTVTVFDGQVTLANPGGEVLVSGGEMGVVNPGQPPVKRPLLPAENLVQWWLYYPAVLDLKEVPFSDAEQAGLRASLRAYAEGDLVGALERWPVQLDEEGGSQAQQLYRAGLLLAVGEVAEVEKILEGLDHAQSLRSLTRALRRIMAAVTQRGPVPAFEPESASEWLGESYVRQRNFDLDGALAAARSSVAQDPEFALGWARVAELEFCFGRVEAARQALRRALDLAPRHAQAWAVEGFLLAAQNRMPSARQAFERALSLDGALGNAWLGRGLCRIRQGDDAGGRADLQTAAALEPNRSLLRSYLGKSFANEGDLDRARKELRLARDLDPADPTAWLYLALLDQEANRVNSAVRNLEQSTARNDNRQVYRSRLLLDQDRAVRSANLAAIYQQAGMTNVSLGESARAVTADYANHSAHLFLSQSYYALRDPTLFSLRYESAWFNELLLAHLLAPVGAGTLSATVSQQEYSKLFEADGLGFFSDTQWRSDHQVRERAAQFGTVDNTSYALDLDFLNVQEDRPQPDLTRLEWQSRIKQQLSPQDSILLMAEYTDFSAGDFFQYYDPEAERRPNYRAAEKQEPNAVAGYHHAWSPGSHTLLLAGRLENHQEVSDQQAGIPVIYKRPNGQPNRVGSALLDVDYENEFETYLGELNQIFQRDRHTLVAGGRVHSGQFTTTDLFTQPDDLPAPLCFDQNLQPVPCFQDPAASGRFTDDFERYSVYGYYTLELWRDLRLTGGVAYDHITYPANYRNPPVFEGETSRQAWNPKAALVWSPQPALTLRGVYAQSLGGISFDENYRLEPPQLAGFAQSYRTVISESVVGSVSAPDYEIAGLALDLKVAHRTYAGLLGQQLRSEVDRELGVFDFVNVTPPLFASSTPEELDYRETTLTAYFNRLWGDHWMTGLEYLLVRSELDRDYPAIPERLATAPHQDQQSDLHRLSMRGLFQHPSGFFAGIDLHWFLQENAVQYASGHPAPREVDLPGDDFPMLNLFAGLRLARGRRAGDLTVGLLNLTDENYHLNPLNSYPEMPRERTLLIRTRFRF